VGWIYEYALVDRTGQHDLAQLRTLQDWFLKYELQTVSGVAEVATVGGMVKQYQVVPRIACGPTDCPWHGSGRPSNGPIGGSVIEMAEADERSALIQRAVDTLNRKLVEEFLVVALICAAFLFHLRSALVIILSLPVGILVAFIIMYHQGINANIMSLGGIAIAIGAMVDAAIVMIENAHKHLERETVTNDSRQIS
jgi:Cu/Ag efflux pump CusA